MVEVQNVKNHESIFFAICLSPGLLMCNAKAIRILPEPDSLKLHTWGHQYNKSGPISLLLIVRNQMIMQKYLQFFSFLFVIFWNPILQIMEIFNVFFENFCWHANCIFFKKSWSNHLCVSLRDFCYLIIYGKCDCICFKILKLSIFYFLDMN